MKKKPVKIMIEVFQCPYCKQTFQDKAHCVEHIEYYCFQNKSADWYWYVVEKTYRNASDLYVFQTTIPEEKWEEYDLLEHIGENTSGGESYGYRLNGKRRSKSKPYPNKNKNEKFIYFILPNYLRAIQNA